MVWGEVQKALRAASLTRRQALYRFRVRARELRRGSLRAGPDPALRDEHDVGLEHARPKRAAAGEGGAVAAFVATICLVPLVAFGGWVWPTDGAALGGSAQFDRGHRGKGARRRRRGRDGRKQHDFDES